MTSDPDHKRSSAQPSPGKAELSTVRQQRGDPGSAGSTDGRRYAPGTLLAARYRIVGEALAIGDVGGPDPGSPLDAS